MEKVHKARAFFGSTLSPQGKPLSWRPKAGGGQRRSSLGGDEPHGVVTTDLLEDWLCDAVEFYLPLGFFQRVKGTPDDLIDKLLPHFEAQQQEQELEEEDLESPEFDLFFLSFDPMRTLYESMNFGAGLGPGLDAYVSTLTALARISRGALRPTEIAEHWDSPKGPIRVSFKLEGKSQELKVDTWDGNFDFRVLLQLNLLLWDTPYRYEMAPMDDILFVTVLTAQEKTKLERLRGLSFMVLDLPRNFLPLAELSPPLSWPEDHEDSVFYCGTLNENLDRCVGRLRFILRKDEVEGYHRYDGDAYQEDFTFRGAFDRASGKLHGSISGFINVGEEQRPYQGSWKGQMAPGDRVITGTWQGQYVHPEDGEKVYQGQWGLLEEDSLNLGDPYVARTHEWLKLVWSSRNIEDYPWLLPS